MDSLQKAISLFRLISYLFLFYIIMTMLKPLMGVNNLFVECLVAIPGLAAFVLSPIGLILLLKGDWKSMSFFRRCLYLGGYLFYNLICLLMIVSFVFMLLAGPR